MLTPVDFTAVQLADEFWLPRVRTIRDHTLPHVFAQCEETHRIRNFEVAAGRVEGEHEGYFFNDSDVYKALEGAANLLALTPDAALEKRMDDLIALFAAAQQDDGYLNTYFQVAKPGERWTNDRFHELYCAGHLIEAALAWEHATGKHNLLDVAERYVDHIETVFGPGRRLEAPEHPEIELALIKLWRRTGEQRHLDLARFFIEQRGHDRGRPAWGEYAQDHLPVEQQTEVVGHAVRAMYLYCAMTDMAAIADDHPYLTNLDQLWQDLTTRKMYITGGIGVSSDNEGFTHGFDLPNEDSYAETCASIGLALWAHRLNLLHRDARYFDVFERVVFNGALSGVALDGETFLYANPLASRGAGARQHGSAGVGEGHGHRRPWFKCACCPPNILRFFPTIGGYAYAQDDTDLYVNFYVASQAQLKLGEKSLELIQDTRYPWDGAVRLYVRPAEPTAFALYLRIPGWCGEYHVAVNGEQLDNAPVQRGYIELSRTWKHGDVVTLDLAMPATRVACDPRVRANVGRLALQRGPIVYCVEDVDNPGGVWSDFAIPRDTKLTDEHRPDLLGGVTVITGPAWRLAKPDQGDGLYYPAQAPTRAAFTAIPYYAWDNRRPGGMTVWIPEGLSLTEPPAPPK